MMSVASEQRVMRADARRNIAAILDAAEYCLVANPDASLGDIAKRAGVGRITLYGHFPSRAELVDAVFTRAVAAGDEALDAIDLGGDPRQALTRLITASWHIIHQFRALQRAAANCLSTERMRSVHDKPMERVQALIERGRREGVFRSDLPVTWMVALYHSLIHSAADEVNAGRLERTDVAALVTKSLVAAFTAPGKRVPQNRRGAG
jgi:TetR/AcrR family transcriptional repressor of mexCD-oprJ operon